MELHQLRYFEAVARHLHFTRAAQELSIAQPSVSQQIAKLELELGAQLFHRMKRRVALTPFGEVLPGVPVSTWDGVTVVTKAGGFGDDDVVATVMEALR